MERNIPNLAPVTVVVTELSRAELAAPSVIYDEALGRELTVWEQIQASEAALYGAQSISVNHYEHLTAQARIFNEELVNGGSKGQVDYGQQIVAVVSHRPTPEQLAYRQSLLGVGVDRALQTNTARLHMPTHHEGSHGTTHSPHRVRTHAPVTSTNSVQ